MPALRPFAEGGKLMSPFVLQSPCKNIVTERKWLVHMSSNATGPTENHVPRHISFGNSLEILARTEWRRLVNKGREM